MKKVILFLTITSLLLITFSCGGGRSSQGVSPVTVSATFLKSDTSKSLLRASTLTLIRYTVSGSGMDAMTGAVPVTGNLVEFVLDVPNGPQRHFFIEALDAEENVRYSGEAYQDLDGRPVTIVIELVEKTLDVSGDWLFYRTALGELQEKGPFCWRITQAGEVLSVVGYEPGVRQGSGSGTLRGNDIDLTLSYMACDNQATLTIKATTDGNTMSGSFTLTGGCQVIPVTGSWRAERGECSLQKAEVSVRIAYFEGTYSLDFFADQVSDVQITSGTVSGPQVATLNLDYTCSVGSCWWFAIASFGQISPTAGDTYSFTIQYSDGSSEVLSDSVYDLGVGVPAPVSPQKGETVSTTTPTFSWQAPTWGCASWYHLIVRNSSGNEIWWPAIPGDTTSAVYNFNGQATQPLTPGERYSWIVNAFDDCEHQNAGHDNFAGADGGMFTVSSVAGDAATYNTVDYFPLGLGDTWTYLEDNGGYTTETVSGTESIDSVIAQKLELVGEGDYVLLTVDNNGLRLYKEYETEDGMWELYTYDPPITYLPAHFSIGTVQTFTSTFSYIDSEGFSDTGTISGTVTVEGFENVTVPAGSFEGCLRIRTSTNFSFSDGFFSETTESTMWFAKGVGTVKDIGSGIGYVYGEQVDTDTWNDVLVSATVGGMSYPSP